MLDINKIQKLWDEYETAFSEDDYMDIDDHTSMAFKVPALIREIERLREGIDKAIYDLTNENIIDTNVVEAIKCEVLIPLVNQDDTQ